ncbi:MAG: DUF6036 family nucleotidyltransferase [Akkermansiaceae bacterium]
MSVGRELFEQDLKVALAAAASAYRRKRFVIVGSAAILATHPDAPSFLRLSADIDMFPIRKLDTTDFQSGDEQVGQASAFEVEHEFYIERLGDWTMLSQPEGWFERCVKYSTPGEVEGEKVTVDGYCLLPLDLAYNKLEAGRDKDLNFVAGLLAEKIISLAELEEFIKVGCPHEDFLPTIAKNLELIKAAM